MKQLPSIVHQLSGKHILVTGGAGFIGSNLTETLLEIGAKVTVLDNLSTGFESNFSSFQDNPNFTFINGDIRNEDDCKRALEGVDAVSHQAALGSVPRSIEFPMNTHDVNATGFLSILHAVKEKGIKRFVYASSSSVYGDSLASPKREGDEGKALSPYAVTKQLNEQYAGVYALLHEMEIMGLRYFNVFGPRQNPDGVYAAAIPRFLEKMLHGGDILVHGDGNQTRDFTFVKNAVLANLLALSTDNSAAFGSVFNVACGQSFSLNQVISELEHSLNKLGFPKIHSIIYGPERKGDIRDSLANISHIETQLGYKAQSTFGEGIRHYLEYVV